MQLSTPRKTPDAAAYLGVSISFLTKDRARGGARRIGYRRAGRAVIYDQEHLDQFRRESGVEPVGFGLDPDPDRAA
jgi:hypothetical protein